MLECVYEEAIMNYWSLKWLFFGLHLHFYYSMKMCEKKKHSRERERDRKIFFTWHVQCLTLLFNILESKLPTSMSWY